MIDVNQPKKFVSIKADVIEYYAYLPAFFIYHDIGFGYAAKDPKTWSAKVWCLKSPTGKTIGRMSVGMALTYTPFFLLAHAYSHLFGYNTDGYSTPYHVSILLAGLFYMLAGMYLIGKFLLRFFEIYVVLIVLLAIAFGTNFFYLTTCQTAMPHATLFGLIAAFVYFTAKYFDVPKNSHGIILGLLFGLITLIRPTGAVVILFFVLYQVDNLEKLWYNVKYFFHNWVTIFLFILMVGVIWFPQLLYWKTFAGSWLFFSYGIKGEHFFFSNPQIINQLFSYRNGWILYTPLVGLMLIGFFSTFKYNRGLLLPTLAVVVVSIYVLSSWWCWWFVGSFGNRAYIEFYAFLAVPLISLVAYFWKKGRIGWIAFSMLLVSIILLNFVQTNKFVKGSIHFDSMTREAYWHSYSITKPDSKFYNSLLRPNYIKAKAGVYFKYDRSNYKDYAGYLEDKVLKDSLLNAIKLKMISNPKTVDMLQAKADKKGISLDEMLDLDAKWIFRKKYNLPPKPPVDNTKK